MSDPRSLLHFPRAFIVLKYMQARHFRSRYDAWEAIFCEIKYAGPMTETDLYGIEGAIDAGESPLWPNGKAVFTDICVENANTQHRMTHKL